MVRDLGSSNGTFLRLTIPAFVDDGAAAVAWHTAVTARLGLGVSDEKVLDLLDRHGPLTAGALVRPKDPLEYERKLAVHRASPDLVLFGAPAAQ